MRTLRRFVPIAVAGVVLGGLIGFLVRPDHADISDRGGQPFITVGSALGSPLGPQTHEWCGAVTQHRIERVASATQSRCLRDLTAPEVPCPPDEEILAVLAKDWQLSSAYDAVADNMTKSVRA